MMVVWPSLDAAMAINAAIELSDSLSLSLSLQTLVLNRSHDVRFGKNEVSEVIHFECRVFLTSSSPSLLFYFV